MARTRKIKRQAPYIPRPERERIILCEAGSRYEKRNIALIRLGFATGMRACELRDLCFNNLFNDKWELKEDCYIFPEQTKGGYGAGAFYLPKLIDKNGSVKKNGDTKVRRALLDYLVYRKEIASLKRKPLTLDSPFFESQKGSQFKLNDLRILIKSIFKKAGVEGSSHSFRRTFATDFTKNNPDPKALQEALRHASPVMSLEYVSRNQEVIKNIIRNFVQD